MNRSSYKVWNAAIIPILGPAAFEKQSGELTTASEMYIDEKRKLLILQTRTPLTGALLSSFIAEIVKFVQENKVGSLVILTSSYSHEQHFVGKNPFEYFANNLVIDKNFAGFTEASTVEISGSGYAKLLFQHATENNIPTTIFYKSVSEGDNSYDGIQLCQKVDEILNVLPAPGGKQVIKTPISWKFLFGRTACPEIY